MAEQVKEFRVEAERRHPPVTESAEVASSLARWRNLSFQVLSTALQLEEAAFLAHQVREALAQGDEQQARVLSKKASSLFPQSQELARLHTLLSPPVVRGRPPATRPSRARKAEWLAANRQEFLGKWVAIREGTLVAAAGSLHELLNQVDDRRRILFTRVC